MDRVGFSFRFCGAVAWRRIDLARLIPRAEPDFCRFFFKAIVRFPLSFQVWRFTAKCLYISVRFRMVRFAFTEFQQGLTLVLC